MSYCIVCGKRTEVVETGLFDEISGDKAWKFACPEDPCRHSNVHHWVYDKGKMSGDMFKCSRCGAKAYTLEQAMNG